MSGLFPRGEGVRLWTHPIPLVPGGWLPLGMGLPGTSSLPHVRAEQALAAKNAQAGSQVLKLEVQPVCMETVSAGGMWHVGKGTAATSTHCITDTRQKGQSPVFSSWERCWFYKC